MSFTIGLSQKSGQEAGQVDKAGNVISRESSYVYTYKVISDVDVNVYQVLNAEDVAQGRSLPKIGHALSTDLGLYATNRTAKQMSDNDYKHWLVDITYSQVDEIRPIDMEPIIEFQSVIYTEVAERASYYRVASKDETPGGDYPITVGDVPILNSAKDKFDPPVEIEKTHARIIIQKNYKESEFLPAYKYDYENSVNEEKLKVAGMNIAARCAKMIAIECQISRLGNVDKTPYWLVKYTIEVNNDNFDKKLLDAGFNYIDASDDDKKKQFLIDGQRASDPQPLNGTGDEGDITDPKYLHYGVYPLKKWKVFALPEELYVTAGGAQGTEESTTTGSGTVEE
jgi:hypothetical protein